MSAPSVLVLGDTHGNLPFIRDAVTQLAVPHGLEIVHVVGDFGYWTHSDAGMRFLYDLNKLARLNDVLITFTDGNHENFDNLYEQPIDDDGWRRITDRIWHAPRGHTWEWGNARFLSLGGANSIDGPNGATWWRNRWGQGRGPVAAGDKVATDRGARVTSTAVDLGGWWPQEDITQEDVDRTLEAAQGLNIDFMFTHDCPTDVNLPGMSGYPAGDRNRMLVQTVVEQVKPRALIHGHYHMWNHAGFEHDDESLTEVVGLAHDMSNKGGQYVIIETGEPNLIIPRW